MELVTKLTSYTSWYCSSYIMNTYCYTQCFSICESLLYVSAVPFLPVPRNTFRNTEYLSQFFAANFLCQRHLQGYNIIKCL